MLLAVLLSACNAVAPAAAEVSYPRGAQLVVRAESSGGFVPYESLFTAMPQLSILGDGRVIEVGPPGETFPGPAIRDIRVRRLTDRGMQTVLRRVAESGQLNESASWTGATAYVVDAITTVFTVHTNDEEIVVDVYGLNTSPAEGVDGELPEDERAVHQALESLQAYLLDLDAWIQDDEWADSDWQTYEPQAIRLLIGSADGEEPNPDASGGAPVPWPGTIPPAELGQESPLQDLRCGVVAGAEAATWYEALRDANELTRFVYDGHLYRVVPRPLLPDEELTCGTLEG